MMHQTDEQEVGETLATVKRRPRGKGNKDTMESRRMELENEIENKKKFLKVNGKRCNMMSSLNN